MQLGVDPYILHGKYFPSSANMHIDGVHLRELNTHFGLRLCTTSHRLARLSNSRDGSLKNDYKYKSLGNIKPVYTADNVALTPC